MSTQNCRKIATMAGLLSVVVAVALTFEGCSDRNRPGSGPSITKRGDTTVLTVASPRHPQRGELVTDWTVGGSAASEDAAFSFISEITVGTDGAVYVTEFGGNAPPVRRYDRSGKYIGTIGRRGQGPGEYFFATGLKELRDGRLALRDMQRRLIHFYSPTGEPDTTWRFPAVITGCLGANTLLTDTAGFVYVRDGQCERRGAPPFNGLIRLGADGTIVDSLPWPDVGYTAAVVTLPARGEIPAWSIPMPFAPRAHAEWSPLGYLVTGTGSTYAIDLRIPLAERAVEGAPAARGVDARRASQWMRGDSVVSIRRDVTPLPVTSAERKEQIAIVSARGRQRQKGWEWDASGMPTTKPVYRRLQVGDDGRIWVLLSSPALEIEHPPGAAQRTEFRDAPPIPVARWVEPEVYDILETDGAYVGQVEMPRGFQLYTMRGDTLWGVSRDADDVPVLQRLHIVWR
jgi:hypothetical protein